MTIRRERWRRWWHRTRFNLFPPYLFSRTRCVYIAPGYRTVRMQVTRSWLNRNINGSIFGGTLYALADPIHAIMLSVLLPAPRVAWTKAARIAFLKPAHGTVQAEFQIGEDELAELRHELMAAGKAEHTFSVEITNDQAEVVARAEVVVHVRRR